MNNYFGKTVNKVLFEPSISVLTRKSSQKRTKNETKERSKESKERKAVVAAKKEEKEKSSSNLARWCTAAHEEALTKIHPKGRS